MASFLIAVGLVASCVPTHVSNLEAQPGGAQNAGSVALNGEEYHLDECYSGDRAYYLGVDLIDSLKKLHVRLLIDPLVGPELRVTRLVADAPRTELLSRATCRVLEADVEPTGWRVNSVRDVKGTLEADCSDEAGTTFKAKLNFSHCH